MIGRRQAEPGWLSWAGERRIKDSYQFSVFSFRLKGPPAKSPIKGYCYKYAFYALGLLYLHLTPARKSI